MSTNRWPTTLNKNNNTVDEWCSLFSTHLSPEGRVIAHSSAPEAQNLYTIQSLKDEIALLDSARGEPPLFVSYYTKNTPYEALADQLRKSLDRFRLPHRIEAIDSLG